MIPFLLFLLSCRTTRVFTDQDISITLDKRIADLPIIMQETSGLERKQDSLVTFNDSGGKAELYVFSPAEPLNYRVISLKGARNRDWEGMAADGKYFYIGDFGNNFGSRDTLTILKYPANGPGSFETEPWKITFTFKEKGREWMNKRHNPFDCEAITIVNDSAWIFTKNWQDKSSWVYKIPLDPGHYDLEVQNILNPGLFVTGADYIPEKNIILLIGYNFYLPGIRAYSLEENEIKDLFIIRFWNRFGVQTEAIVCMDDYNVFYTNEKSLRKQGLFRIEIEIPNSERNK